MWIWAGCLDYMGERWMGGIGLSGQGGEVEEKVGGEKVGVIDGV